MRTKLDMIEVASYMSVACTPKRPRVGLSILRGTIQAKAIQIEPRAIKCTSARFAAREPRHGSSAPAESALLFAAGATELVPAPVPLAPVLLVGATVTLQNACDTCDASVVCDGCMDACDAMHCESMCTSNAHIYDVQPRGSRGV